MKKTTEVLLFAVFGILFLASAGYMFSRTPKDIHSAHAAVALATNQDNGGDGSTDSSSTDATPTSPKDAPFSTTTYQYKLVQGVDPCTMNSLGARRWKPVTYGTNSLTGDYLDQFPGKDETCKVGGSYVGLIWAMFEFSTSTTDNTLTTDTASAAQYKIVRNIDPCMFNTLGSKGWRAIQFGVNVLYSGVTDETCTFRTKGFVLDWALFELPLQ